MKAEIRKIQALTKYFRNLETANETIHYNFKLPSLLLMNNIYLSWLQSIFRKTNKNFTIYTHKRHCDLNGQFPMKPFGYLENNMIKYNDSTLVKQDINSFTPRHTSDLKLNLFVPQQDSQQYFIQWNRYRKYWWSSITTTPSLFAVNEINYASDTAEATIIPKFSCGPHTVETIRVTLNDANSTSDAETKINNMSHLSCSMSLEGALYVLLLDGLQNNTKEEYLRLHRNMTPYKISFALNYTDKTSKELISELAKLMHYKLRKNKISSFLPNFTLSMDKQINENLQLGVAYTAVLCETTLSTGILNLLCSNTMLKEQVHLADFDAYAELLFQS